MLATGEGRAAARAGKFKDKESWGKGPDGHKGLKAHDIVGVLIPIHSDHMRALPSIMRGNYLVNVSADHFDWLGWSASPIAGKEIKVLTERLLGDITPPSFEKPILQSNVDIIMQAALRHGEDFAREWLDGIHWWWVATETQTRGLLNEDGPGRGRLGDKSQTSYYLNDRQSARRTSTVEAITIDNLLNSFSSGNLCQYRLYESEYAMEQNHQGLVRERQLKGVTGDSLSPRVIGKYLSWSEVEQANTFVVGFGSIISTESRLKSDPSAADAAPCRIKASWGYVREWNFQSATAQVILCSTTIKKT